MGANQNAIEKPGETCRVEVQGKVMTAQAVTAGSYSADFYKVKHLLSDKPLRRPSRTRPLEK
jgi:hypothetical protein